MIVAIVLALVVLAAVGAFVWTVVRTAVRQVTDNHRAGTDTVAWFDAVDPDAPVDLWPTYTDPRAVDLDAVPVNEPLTGATAQAMREALRTDPRRVGRTYDEINAATGGRDWDELKKRCY